MAKHLMDYDTFTNIVHYKKSGKKEDLLDWIDEAFAEDVELNHMIEDYAEVLYNSNAFGEKYFNEDHYFMVVKFGCGRVFKITFKTQGKQKKKSIITNSIELKPEL